MSLLSLSLSVYGIIFLLLSNTIVDGYLIRSVCRNPNSELCKRYHQRNQFIRYLDVTDNNPMNINDDSMVVNTFNEDIQRLRDHFQALAHRHAYPIDELTKCINLGDDSCNNGSIPGSGKDDDFLTGPSNPGKRSRTNGVANRCINLGDDGCVNGSLHGSEKDDDFLNGGVNPGKRFF